MISKAESQGFAGPEHHGGGDHGGGHHGGGHHGGGHHGGGHHGGEFYPPFGPGPWIPPPANFDPFYSPYPNINPYPYPYPNPPQNVFVSLFDAYPPQIARGEAVTLTWSVTGASTMTIDGLGGGVPFTGSQSVYPNISSTYTLRAYDNYGTEAAVRVVQVNVVERPPTIGAFWADRIQISRGEKSVLHLSASNCRQIQLTANGDPTGSGSYGCIADIDIYPQQTTSYNIRVTGSNYQTIDGSPITITVNQPPQKPLVEHFYVSPSTIERGQTAQLHWSVTKSNRVDITGVSGQMSLSGSTTVSPDSTTTFILRAYGEGGTVTEIPATITVKVPIAPTKIDILEASPIAVEPNQATTLSWSASNCLKAEILEDQLRQVPCQGSLKDTIVQTKSYTLRVAGTDGSTTSRMISVAVKTPSTLPSINQFVASSLHVLKGESVTLYWSTNNATRVEFVGIDLPNQPTTGSYTFVPQSTLAIRLNAFDNFGQIATSILSFSLGSPLRPSIGYFYGNGSVATAGKPYKIQWDTHNCAHVRISALDGQDLPSEGSTDILLQTTNKVTLRCVGFDGSFVESPLPIVTIPQNATQDAMVGALLDVMRGS